MPYARTYSLYEVMAALRESDGRASPFNGQPGHALALHVHARGLQISDRVRPTGEDLPGSYRGMTSASGRPLGNPGTAPITTPGRAFVMGSSTVAGPGNGQGVKDTWLSYELQKKHADRAKRIAAGLASGKPRLIANAHILAAQPAPTVGGSIVSRINRTYAERHQGVEFSGVFADSQQAVIVAQHVLNSTIGFQALRRLDAGEERVIIETPVAPAIGDNPVLLLQSRRDVAGGDIPVLRTITSACMLVDRMPGDNLHIHTFYPVP
jgi:hypothetical protein